MLPNTITITRDGTANVLSRIRDDGYTSEYFFRDTNQEIRLRFRHSLDKADPRTGVQMERHNYAYERTVLAVAPALPVKEVLSVSILNQKGGDPVAAHKTALAALTFASSANLTALINWES